MKKRHRTKKRKAAVTVASTATRRLPARLPGSQTSHSGQANSSAIVPPQLAEKLLHFVLPKDESEAEIGDLAEHYKRVYPKLGAKCARAWYYKEVWMLVWRRSPSVIKKFVFGWILEFIRRHIS
jgi:hypothetical protein